MIVAVSDPSGLLPWLEIGEGTCGGVAEQEQVVGICDSSIDKAGKNSAAWAKQTRSAGVVALTTASTVSSG